MRFKSMLAALAVALSLPLAPAQAAEGNAVIVGDSIPANATLVDFLGAKLPAQSSQPLGSRINDMGCGADGTFAEEYRLVSGRDTRDYTCPGASLFTGGVRIDQALDKAAADGALGPGTQEVVIQAGANDTYPNMAWGYGEVHDRLVEGYANAVRHARNLAPNAVVKISGYPSIMPDGRVCPVKLIPGVEHPGVWLEQAQVYEDILQKAAAAGAAHADGVFVDNKPVTAGHDMCSADSWIAGVIDTSRADYHLPLHAAIPSLRAMAGNTARA